MDAKARAGKRDGGGGEDGDNTLGPYGREELNESGKLPLTFAATKKLALNEHVLHHA